MAQYVGRFTYLYVPDNFSFDWDAFLHWAGPEKVTFLYARTAGRLTVYQIQQGDRVFLGYSQAWERLMTTFLSDFLMWLTLLLFGLGGSVYLPEYLSPDDKTKRNKRILGLAFAALALEAFVVLNHLASRPEIAKTYAAVIGAGENLACVR